MQKKSHPIYLKDYKAPDFLIQEVSLNFDIYEAKTIVTADLHIKRNGRHKRPLKLNGEELKLLSVSLDYDLDSEHLIIKNPADDFTLQTKVEIEPHKNTKLEGLYKSKANFYTQCEPHGFRRITYFIDRPDVMTKFTTTISADKKNYPIVLSNGNLIAQGKAKNNRHWVTWQDPSLKSCYLFALVAGDLDYIQDKYITKSKRKIDLKIYVDKGYKEQCWHAMRSLQKAMRWDEEVFGLEYDLDIYMIVAVSDFNMGAMENKGLNIFNIKRVIADPKTATDDDYLNIENVVAHEYFHNWTGNRITCRDWFQLTLKEGLTTFRDQLFTEDMTCRAIKRIEEANIIRSLQFAEDAGPMAHPIQPKSYIEINNFYTVTIYQKGAEVIRMLYTILGEKKFNQGMKLYIKRCDGKPATTDDFIKAMQKAANIDLTQFKKWYKYAGTPVLNISSKYDNQVFKLIINQSKNFYIPLAIGLLDKKRENTKTQILHIKNKTEIFAFKNIKQQPLPSLLRNFSAPVKINYSYTNQDLMFLMQHDSDAFSRWNAGQQLMTNIIMFLIKTYQNKQPLILLPDLVNTFKNILHDDQLDDDFIALLLSFPNFTYLIELMDVADVEAIFYVREFIKTELVKNLSADLLNCYKKKARYKKYTIDSDGIGRRSLKNLCLYYLTYLNHQDIIDLCLEQFNTANNMTDIIGSLRALVDLDVPETTKALKKFYNKWQHEDLVINKWLELQAVSKLPNTIKNVKALSKSPAFDIKNPNKVYSLIRTFCRSNQMHFHDKKGGGYKFLSDQVIKLDKINPLLAAHIIEPLTNWQKFASSWQSLMKKQLLRIKGQSKLSKNVYEIVAKSLVN